MDAVVGSGFDLVEKVKEFGFSTNSSTIADLVTVGMSILYSAPIIIAMVFSFQQTLPCETSLCTSLVVHLGDLLFLPDASLQPRVSTCLAGVRDAIHRACQDQCNPLCSHRIESQRTEASNRS